jgi:arginine decarboxylase
MGTLSAVGRAQFISRDGVNSDPVLPLHEVVAGEPYYLAMFLTGAYQEVMGSSHNMFGALHAVTLRAPEELHCSGGETRSGFT